MSEKPDGVNKLQEEEEKLKKAIENFSILECLNKEPLSKYLSQNFLHTLCPKHVNEIDDAWKSKNHKKIKSIVKKSLFDDLKPYLDKSGRNNLYFYDVKSNSRIVLNNISLMVIPTCIIRFFKEGNLCWWSKIVSIFLSNSSEHIYKITLHNGTNCLKIHYGQHYGQNLWELSKKDQEVFEFIKTLSLSEVEVYLNTLKKNLSNIDLNTVTKEDIIKAMRTTQEEVEKNIQEKGKDNNNEMNNQNQNNDGEPEIANDKCSQCLKNIWPFSLCCSDNN